MNKTIFLVIVAVLILTGCTQTPSQVEVSTPTAGPADTPTATADTDLSQYYGERPPPAVLIVGDQQQMAGTGNTTWTVRTHGDETTLLHGDAFSLVTPAEPMVVSSPFTATLVLPIPIEPSKLMYGTLPAADHLRWETSEGSPANWGAEIELSGEGLALVPEQEIQFDLEPGRHLLEVYVEWEDLGDVDYGFYLEVPGDGGETQTSNALIYTDPDEQFRYQVPPGWQAGDEDGRFYGMDGMVQVGYLPEMAFIDRIWRVCESLANTPQGPARQIMLSGIQNVDTCFLYPYPEMSTDIVRLVVENPNGEPEQRYFYLDADRNHIDAIAGTLELLNPPGEREPFPYPTGPMRPEDEAFWGEDRSMPVELTVEEYEIVEDSVASPSGFEFLDRIPAEVLQAREDWRGYSPEIRLAENNALLEPFGYSLQAKEGAEMDLYQLYQGEELVVDEVSEFWPASVSASGTDFALLLGIWNNGYQLVQTDSQEDWDIAASDFRAPVFYGEELLWAGWDPERSQVQVLQGEADIYSFSAVFMVASPIKGLWTWQDHWVLEVDGFLIQDWENLNERLGYDEIFGFQLLNGKPFYYFRKGPQVGIAYDGQVLPVVYEEIPHYRCCEPAMFNPGGNQDMVWFYGLRDGVWHYVEIGVY